MSNLKLQGFIEPQHCIFLFKTFSNANMYDMGSSKQHVILPLIFLSKHLYFTLQLSCFWLNIFNPIVVVSNLVAMSTFHTWLYEVISDSNLLWQPAEESIHRCNWFHSSIHNCVLKSSIIYSGAPAKSLYYNYYSTSGCKQSI